MRLSNSGLFRSNPRVCARLMLATALAVAGAACAAAAAPDAAALVKQLKAPDAKDRIAAIDALNEMGPEARTAGPALLPLLKDASPEVRWRAARAIASVGHVGDDTTKALLAGLKDEDQRVRAYSAHAFSALEIKSDAVIQGVAVLVADPEAMVRRTAIRTLRSMQLPRSVTVPLWVKTMTESNPDAAMAAAQTLAEGGEKSVSFLRAALAEPKAAYWACLALAEIGPAAKDAAPDITKLLTSQEPNVRLEASMALGAIGAPAKDALPALAKMLTSDPVKGVRYAAAYAIGGIAVPDPSAIDALQKVGDADPFLATVCAWALARANPKDEALVSKAVALLVEGLKSPTPAVRLASVQALEGLGASSKIVGPALVGALKDSDPQVASEAIDVLGTLGPGITPDIVKALEIPSLRPYALQILAKFGPKASAAVAELVLLLDDPTTPAAMRREVHFTLGEIGPAAAPATPQLVGALGSNNERLRNSAIYALGRIGPDARPATKTLERLAASKEDFVRAASYWALVQINPNDKDLQVRAAPELTKGLSSERELMRVESARVLGQMGAAGKIALPALKQAASDPSPVVAAAAKKAIAQLEGRAETAPAPDKQAPTPDRQAPTPDRQAPTLNRQAPAPIQPGATSPPTKTSGKLAPAK